MNQNSEHGRGELPYAIDELGESVEASGTQAVSKFHVRIYSEILGGTGASKFHDAGGVNLRHEVRGGNLEHE